MTDKQALIDLRDAVVAGWFFVDASPRDLGLSYLVEDGFDVIKAMYDAFSGSVNAAITLQEAVLPGWDWLVASTGYHGNEKPTAIIIKDATKEHDRDTFEAEDEIPARAILIAILDALIAGASE